MRTATSTRKRVLSNGNRYTRARTHGRYRRRPRPTPAADAARRRRRYTATPLHQHARARRRVHVRPSARVDPRRDIRPARPLGTRRPTRRDGTTAGGHAGAAADDDDDAGRRTVVDEPRQEHRVVRGHGGRRARPRRRRPAAGRGRDAAGGRGLAHARLQRVQRPADHQDPDPERNEDAHAQGETAGRRHRVPRPDLLRQHHSGCVPYSILLSGACAQVTARVLSVLMTYGSGFYFMSGKRIRTITAYLETYDTYLLF